MNKVAWENSPELSWSTAIQIMADYKVSQRLDLAYEMGVYIDLPQLEHYRNEISYDCELVFWQRTVRYFLDYELSDEVWHSQEDPFNGCLSDM